MPPKNEDQISLGHISKGEFGLSIYRGLIGLLCAGGAVLASLVYQQVVKGNEAALSGQAVLGAQLQEVKTSVAVIEASRYRPSDAQRDLAARDERVSLIDRRVTVMETSFLKTTENLASIQRLLEQLSIESVRRRDEGKKE